MTRAARQRLEESTFSSSNTNGPTMSSRSNQNEWNALIDLIKSKRIRGSNSSSSEFDHDGGSGSSSFGGVSDQRPFVTRLCVVCAAENRCIVLRPCGCLCLCDDCREALALRKFSKQIVENT